MTIRDLVKKHGLPVKVKDSHHPAFTIVKEEVPKKSWIIQYEDAEGNGHKGIVIHLDRFDNYQKVEK